MIDSHLVGATLRLCRAINRPWVGAKHDDVIKGKGRIASAYKAADAVDTLLGIPLTKSATVSVMYVR